MIVDDLKKLLNGVDGKTKVLIPFSSSFDGYFKSPCIEESGVSELGITEDGDETDTAFLIIPCGYFEEERGVPPELN